MNTPKLDAKIIEVEQQLGAALSDNNTMRVNTLRGVLCELLIAKEQILQTSHQ